MLDSAIDASTPGSRRFWASIKFGLLAHGARLTPAADTLMHDVKRPLRTRSGVSGGLDIALDGRIDVNVPVEEKYAFRSPYSLDYDGDFIVVKEGTTLCTFQPQPTPAFYLKRTKDDAEPMHRIGQMCSGDRFCYGMTGPTCHFWRRDRRCKYCSIGKNYSADAARKQQSHLMEVLAEAVSDPNLPARHVLLGGGTPPGPDMGALLAADLATEIKARYDLPIYVMIAAPLEDRYIDALSDAGVDELGINMEFWSEEAWRRYIPGKNDLIGRGRYIDALEYAASIFGPIRTRSILIAGLESAQSTHDGALALAERGIMPILSPFRPLDGTMLSGSTGFSGDEYVELWEELERSLAPLDIPLGPTCTACQNNTVSLPFGAHYRKY